MKQKEEGENSMKSREELNAIRNEVETVGRKLAELSEEELQQIAGGRVDLQSMPPITEDKKYVMLGFTAPTNDTLFNFHIYTNSDMGIFKTNFLK